MNVLNGAFRCFGIQAYVFIGSHVMYIIKIYTSDQNTDNIEDIFSHEYLGFGGFFWGGGVKL